MTPEEWQLREDFSNQWAEDRDGMIAEYRARFGKVINAGNAGLACRRALFASWPWPWGMGGGGVPIRANGKSRVESSHSVL